MLRQDYLCKTSASKQLPAMSCVTVFKLLLLQFIGVTGTDTSALVDADIGRRLTDVTTPVPDSGSSTVMTGSTCTVDQIPCYTYTYQSDGWPGPDMTETCASASSGCPCNTEHENECSMGGGGVTSKYCQPKVYGACPLDCGSQATCYHDNMTHPMSCAVGAVVGQHMGICSCQANEISCPNSYPSEWSAQNQCIPSIMGACPVVCTVDQMLCFPQNFDSTGMWQESTGICVAWDMTKTDPCAEVGCGTNAKQCTDSMGYKFCVWSGENCPKQCESGQMSMWMPIFDTTGAWTGDEEKCCPVDPKTFYPDCPCGDNSKKCTSDDGWSMCVGSNEACPVTCNWETEMVCDAQSFDTMGMMLPGGQQTCMPQGSTCECGTNGMYCSHTDGDFSYGWCEAANIGGVAMTCPISCDWTTQTLCYACNYDENGVDTGCTETCIDTGGTCTCGTNSRSCSDEWGSWCQPSKILGVDYPCPVSCTATQTHCYYPAFDSSGNYVSSTDACVNAGSHCDCAANGANTKPCQFVDPISHVTYTDCIWKDGYCPATCAAGKVACWPVDDYDSRGDWVKTSEPQTKCAAKQADCECGLNAKRCKEGEYGFCIPRNYDCPKECEAGKKLCYIQNFDSLGREGTILQECIPESGSCQCGTNAKKCDGEDWCVPKGDVCACKESEKKCDVIHYTTAGSPEQVLEVCVARGSQCPAGRNTKACTDPDRKSVV